MGQIVALALLLFGATAGGLVFAWMKMPKVVGVMTVGVLLGALVDVQSSEISAFAQLSNEDSVLRGVASVAITIFMVSIAYEMRFLNTDRSERTRAWRGASTAAVITLVPMGVGVALAPVTWKAWGGDDVSFFVFAFAQACLFTMTAVPVLQRVLVERDLAGTRLGRLALGQSLITEVVVWFVMAILISIGNADSPLRSVVTFGFFIVTALVVRWLWTGYVLRSQGEGQPYLVLSVLLLGVAALAHMQGESPLFAGLIVGLFLPKSNQADAALQRLGSFNLHWIFPLFFVKVGLDIGFSDAAMEFSLPLWVVTVVLASAFVVKWASGWAGALIAGSNSWSAAGAASLLSLRGATELALAAAFFEASLISPAGMGVFVSFAVVSTIFAVLMTIWFTYPSRAVSVEALVEPTGDGDTVENAPTHPPRT